MASLLDGWYDRSPAASASRHQWLMPVVDAAQATLDFVLDEDDKTEVDAFVDVFKALKGVFDSTVPPERPRTDWNSFI